MLQSSPTKPQILRILQHAFQRQQNVLGAFISHDPTYYIVQLESPQDSAITRDINRTFPAHDYFKDTGGDGQDSLYKICKLQLSPLYRCSQIYINLTQGDGMVIAEFILGLERSIGIIYCVSKCCPRAYSVYDEEIGYCQGQSFLAAVLLLHKTLNSVKMNSLY
ncbi:hypothetical protein P7K49_001673 [Saguinus oedipus]|uniref:Rab-GAP TBC domain-containing protein n=1 Tax=Saguinus oedipus TaxID=9490 RepID=A0ABQ9WF55_SAGOE|nr:hypothetical protein P7K49_001673 [Saguinus oedipus]